LTTATNQVAEVRKHELVPGFGTVASFELMQRQAKLLASSTLVPKEYQGNLSNCVIALNMANRMNADPLMVMQNLYIVHGNPGWSSQFLISTFNASGRFSAIRYEWVGKEGTDSWGCKAWAVEKSTGERLEGSPVTIETAKKEGWYSKKDRNGNVISKWQTMPGQMLMYRAASWFIRAYAPEIAMGMHTAEEIIDTIDTIDFTETSEGVWEYQVAQNANTVDLDIEDVEQSPEPDPEKKRDKTKRAKEQEKPQQGKQQNIFEEGPGF
jgi:hypothetical protein